MDQGRAGSKRRKPDPINQAINPPSNVSQEIPGRTQIVTGKTNSIHSTNSTSDRLINNIPLMPDVPFHLDPLLRNPKQQPMPNRLFKKLTLKLIFILKKIHHFKKASCQRHYKDWTSHFFFRTRKSLGDLINKENLLKINLIYKFLPKQTDIDKILAVIQRKGTKRHSFACRNLRNTRRILI